MPLRGTLRILGLALTLVPAAVLPAATGRGVEFWCAWPRSHASLESSAVIIVLADQPTDVEIDGAFTAAGVADDTAPWIVPVPRTLRTAIERVPVDVGFRIRSVDGVTPISVLFRVPEQAEASDDIARILPLSELGTRYVVSGYSAAIPVAPSYYAVIATEDGTTITTTTTCGGDAGPILLNAGEVYQVFCDTADNPPDITGSIVDADRPVAVLSGSANSWVPTDRLSGDFLVEAIAPVTDWGTEFLTPKLPKGPNALEDFDILRVIASAAGSVTVDDGVVPQVVNLAGEGDWFEIIAFSPLHIQSTAPVDVQLYAPGVESSDIGDPFQATVPHIGAWPQYTRLYIPPDYSEGSFVSLFSSTADTSAVRFGGQPVIGWTPLPDPAWSVARVDLGQIAGTRLIAGPGPVGVLAYGFNATYIPDPDLGRVPGSYGYPGAEAEPACRIEVVGAGPAEACPGEDIVLSDQLTDVFGCNIVEYRWLVGAAPVPGCGFSPDPECVTTYTSPTDYVLEVRCADDPTNCAPGTTIVSVTDAPPVSLTLLPDPAQVCEGQTLRIEAPSGYQSYEWSSVPGDPGVTPQTTALPHLDVTPDVDTVYSVRATGGASCLGTDDLDVTVVPDPLPPFLGNILRVDRDSSGDLVLTWTDIPDPVSGYEAVALACVNPANCIPRPRPSVMDGLGPVTAPVAPGVQSVTMPAPGDPLVYLQLRGLSPCSQTQGPSCDGFPAQVPCP